MQKEGRKKTKLVRSVVAGLASILLVTVLIFALKAQTQLSTVSINGDELRVKIATSSQDRARGLCCRDSLPADEGMLFVYDEPGLYGFWMKNTRIPLDMFWIDSDKQIVHIERNVQPDTYPKTFVSDEPAQYVLETNAGYADRYNVQNRDKVAF